MQQDRYLDFSPELKESEDEIIKKELIDFVNQYGDKFYGQVAKASAIAWIEKQDPNRLEKEIELAYKTADEVQYRNGYKAGQNEVLENPQKYGLEKQGKQKPSDKTKPKFKVGDWITFYGSAPFKILKIEAEDNGILDYLLLCQNGRDFFFNKKYVDENARLWTIQDAKDGDVIAFDNGTIVIFKDLYNATTFHSYCHIKNNIFTISKDDMPNCWEGKGFHPATKKQRELLFQKIVEKGYIWDFEKKELSKIKQKSNWNEEDEKHYQGCLNLMKLSLDTKPYPYYNDYLWLKSLKARYTGKPSDEQMEALWNAIPHIPNSEKDIDTITELSVLYEDLKKIKEG